MPATCRVAVQERRPGPAPVRESSQGARTPPVGAKSKVVALAGREGHFVILEPSEQLHRFQAQLEGALDLPQQQHVSRRKATVAARCTSSSGSRRGLSAASRGRRRPARRPERSWTAEARRAGGMRWPPTGRSGPSPWLSRSLFQLHPSTRRPRARRRGRALPRGPWGPRAGRHSASWSRRILRSSLASLRKRDG